MLKKNLKMCNSIKGIAYIHIKKNHTCKRRKNGKNTVVWKKGKKKRQSSDIGPLIN